MHRIRLHGPWTARLAQYPSLPVEKLWGIDYAPDANLSAAARPELTSLLEQTIQVPADWEPWYSSHPLGANQAYELSRAFGKPTGLEAGQEVWLRLKGKLTVKLWLNESLLIPDCDSELDSKFEGELRFPIASRLLARNRLHLLIEHEPDQPSTLMLETIFLEIDSPGSTG